MDYTKKENEFQLQNNTKKFSKVFKLEQEIRNLQRRIHSPKVDLIERENSYFVRMEVPGVLRSDLKFQLKEDQILLVSGCKSSEVKEEGQKEVYRECKYNEFMRRVKLPGKVLGLDPAPVLENGVLSLNFMKNQEELEQMDFTTNVSNWADSTNVTSWADQ